MSEVLTILISIGTIVIACELLRITFNNLIKQSQCMYDKVFAWGSLVLIALIETTILVFFWL